VTNLSLDCGTCKASHWDVTLALFEPYLQIEIIICPFVWFNLINFTLDYYECG